MIDTNLRHKETKLREEAMSEAGLSRGRLGCGGRRASFLPPWGSWEHRKQRRVAPAQVGLAQDVDSETKHPVVEYGAYSGCSAL